MVTVEAVVAETEEVANTTLRDLNEEVEEIEEDEVAVEVVAAKMASHTASIRKMKPIQSKIINEVGAEVVEVAENSSNRMSKEDRTTHEITKEEKATINDNSVSISSKRSVIEWQMTKTRIN